jgi:hypothetical protein
VRVAAIEVEAGRVRGVTTADGERIPSRYVVSNADPWQTFERLVGEAELPPGWLKRLDRMEPANGLMAVYLGLDTEPSTWGVRDHEIFYNTTLDAERAYTSMMSGAYDDAVLTLTFYTNLGDDFYAPPGKSVLVLNTYTDIRTWPADRAAYAAEKERVAGRMMELAERVLPGLSRHVEVMEVATPRTLQSFTLVQAGTPYGFDRTPEQWAFLPNHSPIDGLFLAGAWTTPGHGVGTAQLSGRETARQVLERERARGLIDGEALQAILDRVPVDRLREVVAQAEAYVGLPTDADSRPEPTPRPVGPVLDATSGATSRYLPVMFHSHAAHTDEYGVACVDCHHLVAGNPSPPASCASCHDQEGAHLDLPDASHRTCRGCHLDEREADARSQAPVACLECHEERR